MRNHTTISISRRKNDEYLWCVTVGSVRYCGTAPSRTEAKSAANQTIEQLKTEEMLQADQTAGDNTLSAWFHRWLSEEKKSCKPITAYTYQNIFRSHIEPALGSFSLQELSDGLLQELLDSIAERYSRTIRNTSRILLYGVLRYAVRQGAIAANPMDKVTQPKSREPRKVSALTKP